MPQYCGSVATQLQLSEAAIATGGARMVRALEHIHSKGLVHMDVKVCSAEYFIAKSCGQFDRQFVNTCSGSCVESNLYGNCREITCLWIWTDTGGSATWALLWR